MQIKALESIRKDRSLVGQFNARRVETAMLIRTELDHAAQHFQRNPDLRDCSIDSIRASLLDAAATGLTLSINLGLAYLIPRGGTCYYSPSYRGLVQLVLRAGTIKRVQTNLVCAKDPVFKVWSDEHGRHLAHEEHRGDRGDVTHAYCLAAYSSGEHHIEVMTRAELDTVQRIAESQGKGGKGGMVWRGPWINEMRKKAVTRRAAKYWPLDDAGWLKRALEVMDTYDPIFPEEAPASDGQVLLNEQQLLELHTAITDYGIADSKADEWLKRKAEAMGLRSLGDAPASSFEELKTFFAEHARTYAAHKE